MAKKVDRWFLFTCADGQLALSKAFKTKKLAEKARLKYPENERGAIGVGYIRQPTRFRI
jgi:hypothetical protein